MSERDELFELLRSAADVCRGEGYDDEARAVDEAREKLREWERRAIKAEAADEEMREWLTAVQSWHCDASVGGGVCPRCRQPIYKP